MVQVESLNSSFVLINQQPATERPLKIKLDCKVTGFPAPWVQWYRNGKLLRNEPGRFSVRTSKWREPSAAGTRTGSARLTRLELQLAAGRNETGIYECRAMNVVAREPALATYRLLVTPTVLAVIRVEPAAGSSTQTGRSQAPPLVPTPASTSPVEGPPPGSTNVTTAPAGNLGQAINTAISTTSTTTTTQPPALVTTAAPQTSPSSGLVVPSSNAIALGALKPTGKHKSGIEAAKEPASRPPALLLPSRAAKTSGSAGGGGGPRAPAPTGPELTGQPCPKEAHDNYCLNKGTCVLIGHIEEFFCK